MAPIAWMTGACMLSWAVVVLIAGSRAHPEALFGMAGPLGSACATWIAARRAHAAAPAQLTAVMVKGFAVKMLFFVVYVVVMLRGLSLRPVPFVASLVGYLIALYAMEALFLKRLTTGTSR